MREIAQNDLLWTSIRMQYDWENEQDWTGYTKEQKEEICNKKGVEIFYELKAKYGVR